MSDDDACRVCDAQETAESLDVRDLLVELRRAAIELADGRIACPDRLVVPMADGTVMLSMPAVADDVAVHKLITVAPQNRSRGLPTIQGHVTVFGSRTGRPLLVLDGPTVTGRRTAAMSMLALEVLAPAGGGDVLLVGTGSQSRRHVEAIGVLHPSARVRVRGTSIEAAERFCRSARDLLADIAPDDGHDRFDVVITCTTSALPVYREAARPDRLLIAVGSFQPGSAEIAAATVAGSGVYVDDPHGARHEAGDLIQAGVDWNRVRPLADVLRDPASRPSEPILFKSVGCAAWDLAAARVALAHSTSIPRRREPGGSG